MTYISTKDKNGKALYWKILGDGKKKRVSKMEAGEGKAVTASSKKKIPPKKRVIKSAKIEKLKKVVQIPQKTLMSKTPASKAPSKAQVKRDQMNRKIEFYRDLVWYGGYHNWKVLEDMLKANDSKNFEEFQNYTKSMGPIPHSNEDLPEEVMIRTLAKFMALPKVKLSKKDE
jgi:hypothetical protein